MKFRSYDRSQLFLLPPSVDDWLPAGHLARFIPDVVSHLDLRELIGRYGDAHEGGAPAYDPAMMVSLLFYAYCVGLWSSRRIERATYEDIAFRFVSGNSHPDHDSICSFRSLHIAAISKLFVQVLMICREAGLVKVGDVVVDGTKILASASGQKTMSYRRLCDIERLVRAKVDELLRSATNTDAAEDARRGHGDRDDHLPKELATAQSRLAAIAAAKSRLEERALAEAREQEAASRKRVEERKIQEEQSGKKKRGRRPAVKELEKLLKDRLAHMRENLTDRDSQLMQDGATKGIIQAYNCQSVVDAHAQIIVAANATTDPNDKQQLVPMLNQAKKNLGQCPVRASADAGYFSRAAVTDASLSDIDLYISPSRADDEESIVEDFAKTEPTAGLQEPEPFRTDPKPNPKTLAGQAADAMRKKLQTTEGSKFYRARGAVVEGPFGQIKEGRGFRRLSMRGKEKADGEWKLVCMTYNILKIWRSGANLAQIVGQTA